jgi:hypothetical protein
MQHLKAIRVFDDNDPSAIFLKLTRTLRMSRPWAARVMLADYSLAKGIAGRWIKTKNGWKQEPGSATATPTLSKAEKRKLREVAERYLESHSKETQGHHVFSVAEKNTGGVFVLVAAKSRL